MGADRQGIVTRPPREMDDSARAQATARLTVLMGAEGSEAA